MSEPHTLCEYRDPFADDVLERLIKSNQDYQRTHGHYIVPLAERLLKARRCAGENALSVEAKGWALWVLNTAAADAAAFDSARLKPLQEAIKFVESAETAG